MLVSAENSKVRIDAKTGERIDLEKQRVDAEAAEFERARIATEEQAEWDRIAADEQAKKGTAEAARQKRLAAERRRKQAEEELRYAKAKAEQDAKEAADGCTRYPRHELAKRRMAVPGAKSPNPCRTAGFAHAFRIFSARQTR